MVLHWIVRDLKVHHAGRDGGSGGEYKTKEVFSLCAGEVKNAHYHIGTGVVFMLLLEKAEKWNTSRKMPSDYHSVNSSSLDIEK